MNISMVGDVSWNDVPEDIKQEALKTVPETRIRSWRDEEARPEIAIAFAIWRERAKHQALAS